MKSRFKRQRINASNSIPRQLRQTFRAVRPIKTHFRVATCKEVNCPRFLGGFQSIVPNGSAQASYMRDDLQMSGHFCNRPHQERIHSDGMVAFDFPPGTECFTEHKTLVGRDDLFMIETVTARRRVQPNQWQDEINANAYSINKAQKEG